MVHVPVARLAWIAHDEFLAYRYSEHLLLARIKRNKQHDCVRFCFTTSASLSILCKVCNRSMAAFRIILPAARGWIGSPSRVAQS